MQERLIDLSKEQNEEIYPLFNRVLVKVDKIEKKTAGGIHIPESAADRESVAAISGIVIDVGDDVGQGYGDGTSPIRPSNHVYFLRHAGTLIKINGEDYRVLNDLDLAGISKKDYLENKRLKELEQ